MTGNSVKPMFKFRIPFIACCLILLLFFVLLIHHNTSSILGADGSILEVHTRFVQENSNTRKNEILDKIQLPSVKKRKLSARGSKLTPQANSVLKDWPRGTMGGVYVEVGAYDGETSSNTLALELYYNWTGLLIEADPDYYIQLLAKHRSAHSLHACISDSNTSQIMYFNNAGGQLGALLPESRAGRMAHNTTIDSPIQEQLCLPLGEILMAMNLSHINYLSLDVEGLEYDVLRTFPYDTIQIDYISAEYLHVRQGQEAMVELMKSKGYRLLDKLYLVDDCRETFVHDFVFVKNDK